MSTIQIHEGPPIGVARAAVPRRHRGRGWIIAGSFFVVMVSWALFRPGSRANDTPGWITEPATIGKLEEVVEGAGTLGLPDGDLVVFVSRAAGVVTGVTAEEGDSVEALTPVIELDGRTLWFVTGDAPLYRDLADGVEGEDVRTLEESLLSAGYDPGEIDLVFDLDTEAALKEWQQDQDLEVTGVFPFAEAVWAPASSRVVEFGPAVGGFLQPGDHVLTVGRSDTYVVRVPVGQAETVRIAVGDSARVDVDGLDSPLTGEVTAITEVPVDGTDYEVTIALDGPDGGRIGMEGRVSIVVDVRDDVILVPTGALAGPTSAPTVDILVGETVETRRITVGLITPTQVEIVSGVSVGELVVLGEVSE